MKFLVQVSSLTIGLFQYLVPLYLFFVSVSSVCLSTGSAVVWSSPTMEILKKDDPRVNPLSTSITLYQESLITSLHAFGIGMGPPLLGKLFDLLGRKRSLILFGFLEMIGFIVLAYGDNVLRFKMSSGSMLGFLYGRSASVHR